MSMNLASVVRRINVSFVIYIHYNLFNFNNSITSCTYEPITSIISNEKLDFIAQSRQQT